MTDAARVAMTRSAERGDRRNTAATSAGPTSAFDLVLAGRVVEQPDRSAGGVQRRQKPLAAHPVRTSSSSSERRDDLGDLVDDLKLPDPASVGRRRARGLQRRPHAPPPARAPPMTSTTGMSGVSAAAARAASSLRQRTAPRRAPAHGDLARDRSRAGPDRLAPRPRIAPESSRRRIAADPSTTARSEPVSGSTDVWRYPSRRTRAARSASQIAIVGDDENGREGVGHR